MCAVYSFLQSRSRQFYLQGCRCKTRLCRQPLRLPGPPHPTHTAAARKAESGYEADNCKRPQRNQTQREGGRRVLRSICVQCAAFSAVAEVMIELTLAVANDTYRWQRWPRTPGSSAASVSRIHCQPSTPAAAPARGW